MRAAWDRLDVEKDKRGELARRTGIPETNLSGMNTGRIPMTREMAERIVASVPGLELEELGAPDERISADEIGKRIAAARERRGWTQMVFAQQANVSLSSVQRWERGDLPPVRELIRIAGVLEIDTEQLVELQPTGDVRLAQLELQVEEQGAKLDRVLAILEAPPPPAPAKRKRSA